MIRAALFAPAIAVIGVLAVASLARTEAQTADAPQVVLQYPLGGETFNQQIPLMQLCFAAPVNIRDKGAGGDFDFSVVRPDGRAIGHVAVFQSDALGVVIERMSQVEEAEGDWLFEWRLTNPDATAEASGEIAFSVDLDSGETPLMQANACLGPEGTATPRPTLPPATGPTPTKLDQITPTPLPAETTLPTDDGTDEEPEEDDDGADTPLIVVGVAAVSAAALLLAAVLWRLSQRGRAGP